MDKTQTKMENNQDKSKTKFIEAWTDYFKLDKFFLLWPNAKMMERLNTLSAEIKEIIKEKAEERVADGTLEAD